MADITIQKQNTVWISESEYNAKKLAGTLENNTVYNITKTPDVGIDTITSLNLSSSDASVTYDSNEGMTISNTAKVAYGGGEKSFTTSQKLPIVAGDGITIDKVNGQEKVEVKLDTAFTDGKYVAKQTTTTAGQSFVYAYDSKGDRQFQITGSSLANTVPIRYNGGRIRVGTAVEDSDAMTKKQVEDGFVPIHNTGKAYTVYCTTQSDGQIIQTNLEFDQSPSTGTIVQRSAGGVVRTGTPVGVNDATTKAYVDGLHHYSHHVKLDLIPSASGIGASICMTVASKNVPNAITSLNDIEVTTSLAYLLYYLGEEVEGWEFSSTGYIKYNDATYMVYALYVDIDYKIKASCINLSTLTPDTLVLTDINETWQVVDFVA